MEWRYFDAAKDGEAAARVWHEIGWLNRNDADARRGMEAYTASGRGYVADVHANPACFVFEAAGDFTYDGADLPFSALTGVATDRTGRKQGLAADLTARALAESAAAGAAVAGLSTFEQGFYDRLGFGTGAYEYYWRFDPARLTVDGRVRPPHHLTADHIDAMHGARLARKRHHGAVTLHPANQTRSTVLRSANGFGLGYFDDGVETPSHCLWGSAPQPARGPYAIEFLAWKTGDQLRELMGLIKQWGDQVRLVTMAEPAGIQLQDLMDRPAQHYWGTSGGTFASGNRAHANYQYRILDLAACIGAVHLPGPPLDMALELRDPMSEWPAGDTGPESAPPWRGLSGTYRVHLGEESHVEPGEDKDLPTLRASVGAFTRLWLGVQPATGLAVTDDLSGPPELLEALDRAFRRPLPRTDWQF